MATEPIQQAIQLIKANQIQEARAVLQPLLLAHPNHISAWLCYALTFRTTQQRIQVLETCLQHNPGSAEIQQRLDQLRAQLPSDRTAIPGGVSQPSPAPLVSSAVPQPSVTEKPSTSVTETPPVAKLPETRAAPAGRRGLLWGVWSLVAVLLVGFIVALVLMIQSTPKDPTAYRHSEPNEYYLYVPPAYKPGQVWPLFIGIHGSGGSGLDCWNLWQSYADREQFILLCPSLADAQGGWYQDEGERKLFAVIQQVKQTVQVEPRYFLAGFSAGAQFVQGVTFAHPGVVRATAVLSARNYEFPSGGAAGIPFMVIIGEADDASAVQFSQQFANAVHQNGSSVDYWLLPGVGHQVTDKTRQLTIDFFRKTHQQ